MKMHVNPMVSDGQFTIGYDADGRAGQWPGDPRQPPGLTPPHPPGPAPGFSF